MLGAKEDEGEDGGGGEGCQGPGEQDDQAGEPPDLTRHLGAFEAFSEAALAQ